MKEKRLLYAIGWVKDEYILEMQQRGTKQKNRKMPSRRIWLIAAVIAALLILAGCMAVFLRLQDMSIGKETYTQYFDDQGRYINPVEKEKDIITLTGYADSPTQKAFQEWYEFQESYDPHRELLTNEPNLPEIPDAEEAVYGCYTSEMVETLHEIAEKYGLQLLDVYTPIQKYQSSIALKALGVDSLLKPNAPAQMGAVSGLLYSPYNFKLEYDVILADDTEYLVVQYYHRNGYFPRNAVGYYDLSQWQQWDYTTRDGVKLLLALNSKGQAKIIADLGHGFMSIGFDSYDGPSLYPQPDEIITKGGLEQVAEIFAYDLPFQEIDVAAIQTELDAAEAAYQETQSAHSLPNYHDFDECLKLEGVWRGPEGYDYTFYDVDADGEVELLFGHGESPVMAIDLEDGETQYRIYGNDFFCENGITHSITTYDFSTYEVHTFNNWPEFKLCLIRKNGVWHKSEEPVDYASVDNLPTLSEAEVQEIFDSYPHAELTWRSVMDYPFADGSTVADLIPEPEPTIHLEGQALRQAYLSEIRDLGWYDYYAFCDIDGNGVEECLVGEQRDVFCMAYTYANGNIEALDIPGDECFLCENGVIRMWNLWGLEQGIEIDAYRFFRMTGAEIELIDYAFYNKATASWQSDLDGTPMPNAVSVMAQYQIIDIDLCHVSKFSDSDGNN